MSIICKICQKKQSGWLQDFPLSKKYLNFKICAECYEHLENIKNGKEIDSAQIYFNTILSSEETCSEVIETINEAFGESETEILQQEQIEILQQEKTSISGTRKINENIGPFVNQELVYTIDGVRGRHIDVYTDKVVITTKKTIGSILAQNATDGEKTIYYSDCIGVQFKKRGTYTIGYLQLETAASSGNNNASNFFSENSFTFDITVISNEKMTEVADYIKSRVDAVKKGMVAPVAAINNNISVADELLKLKQLLDMGILSQEEFDAQKNKLLNK